VKHFKLKAKGCFVRFCVPLAFIVNISYVLIGEYKFLARFESLVFIIRE